MRRLFRGLWAVLTLVGVLAVTTSPAKAHYVYEPGIVATWDHYCTKSRSEVSHGTHGGGYWKTDTESQAQNFYTGVNCIDPFARPANYLGAYITAMVYDAFQGKWIVCFQRGWTYNSQTNAKLVLSYNHSSSSPPCGSNLKYRNLATSSVYDGSAWHGGKISSGDHWLPPA
jgi:hypothetical protein